MQSQKAFISRRPPVSVCSAPLPRKPLKVMVSSGMPAFTSSASRWSFLKTTSSPGPGARGHCRGQAVSSW